MHTIDEGIIPNLLSVVLGMLSNNKLGNIAKYVELLMHSGVIQCYTDYTKQSGFPQISFTGCYTRLTLLSAEERVGQLLVLSILIATSSGCDLLQPRFHPDFDKRKAAARACFQACDDEEEEDDKGIEEREEDEAEREEVDIIEEEWERMTGDKQMLPWIGKRSKVI